MTKVKLRTKAISGARQTLYLDFYPPIPNPETGKPTRREFLGLYTFDRPKNSFEKEQNKQTQSLGEAIRAKRQIEIQNGNYGFLNNEKQSVDFVQYFRDLADKRKASNHDNWISALYYFEQFTGGTLKISALNEKICNEYKEYILSVQSKRSTKEILSQNSAVGYFSKFKAVLKQAYKDGLLQIDFNARIEGIKPAETQREFLTLDEVNQLVKTECKYDVLKRAALFSALTGLRFSDIQKLVWSEVQRDSVFDEKEKKEKNIYYLQFRQQKTKGVELTPISEQAFKLLGARKENTDKVFTGLKYSAYANVHLKRWVMQAGITKDISFHCFRHTYACLQLSLGTDIYTVSKMLGHRELKTTQIYAKIVDATKREAAEKIVLEF